VFLAIQGYASSVSYYLGLGQVYYRLGKRAAAHKQFDRLLAKKDAWIALRVVRAYRVLGAIERARSTAEMVYRDYDKRYRKEAALTIGIIAHDLDKKIEWLRRADQKDAVVRTMLLNAEGKQLLRKGRLVAADKKFAQVVAYFKPRSLHGMAAANNAAGAAWNRYKCTGDGHHLDQAIELYEQALKLEPDNALVMANLMWSLSDRVWHSAFRELADRKALVRMNIDFDHALNALYAGPERPRLLSRMRQHPDLQRVFSLAAQVATLAPSRPAPYKSELLWLSKTRQLEALTRFAKRLEGVKLDFTDSHAAAKRRYSRAGDARSLADAKRDLAKLKKIVLRSSASKKLRASLLLEKAIALETIAWKARDLEAAKQVDRLRMRVKALDSAMGVVRQRVDNLVFIALLDAAKQSDRVGRFIDKHHHGLGGIYLLYVMKQKERALVSLILTRPAFKKALKLCARHLNDNAVEVEAKDVMLAELANDRWLLERTKRFKTDPAKRLLARVYRKLYPYRPMYAVRLSLFER
jgi:tetratricopeptide (TPR) repeat protein